MSVRSIEVLLRCDGCGRFLHVEVSSQADRLNWAEVLDALSEQEWSVGPQGAHHCLACTHRKRQSFTTDATDGHG